MPNADSRVHPDNPLEWPDSYLMSRKQASALMAALGTPLSVSTLAKRAVYGGPDAPPMRYWGNRPRYEVGELKAWREKRLIRARSTTEHEHKTRAREGDGGLGARG